MLHDRISLAPERHQGKGSHRMALLNATAIRFTATKPSEKRGPTLFFECFVLGHGKKPSLTFAKSAGFSTNGDTRLNGVEVKKDEKRAKNARDMRFFGQIWSSQVCFLFLVLCVLF